MRPEIKSALKGTWQLIDVYGKDGVKSSAIAGVVQW